MTNSPPPRLPATAYAVRLLPVLLVAAAAALFIARAETGGPYVGRNMLPLLVSVGLFAWSLRRNSGQWLRVDRRWTLGSLGFAIPAIGLSLYLHANWLYDIDGVATDATTPDLLFRFLPYYTGAAGCIGFAIGWIIGKNVPPRNMN